MSLMTDAIHYFGTERIYGPDGRALEADTYINVHFKGLTGATRLRAGHIGQLHQEPQDSYPIGYILSE